MDAFVNVALLWLMGELAQCVRLTNILYTLEMKKHNCKKSNELSYGENESERRFDDNNNKLLDLWICVRGRKYQSIIDLYNLSKTIAENDKCGEGGTTHTHAHTYNTKSTTTNLF